MNGKTAFRLTQVDFYGILSRRIARIDEKDEDIEGVYEDVDPNKQQHQHFDLWLRSQLYGHDFALESADVQLVRAKIEEEPIPLRSIRIPLNNGLSSAWAPNGYGKTYIFSHLAKLKESLGVTPKERLERGWTSAYDDIKADYPANENIVPYHALGLKMVHEKTLYAVLWLPKFKFPEEETHKETLGGKFFCREVSKEDDIDAFDDQMEWCYGTDDNWTEVNYDWMDPRRRASSKPEVVVAKAVELYTKLDVVYHETPSESDKKGFPDFLHRFQDYLNEHAPLELSERRIEWFEREKTWKTYDVQPVRLTHVFDEVNDLVALLGEPFSTFSNLLDTEKALQDLDSLMASFTSEHDPATSLSDLFSSREMDFPSIERTLTSLPRILFTVTGQQRALGMDFVSALYSGLQNSIPASEEHHPLFEYLDSLMMEYAYLTESTIPDRPTHVPITPWLQYRTISILGRVLNSIGYRDARDDERLPEWLIARVSNLPMFDARFLESDLREHAWDCVRDGFFMAADHIKQEGRIAPQTTNLWPFVYLESFDLADFPAGVEEDLEALHRGMLSNWISGVADADNLRGHYRDAFFPQLNPLPIHLLLLEEEINRCLNPSEIDSNPWAIQAEFSNKHLLEFSPIGRTGDEVHPKHLSFGMRSEVTLQCVLAMFAHKNRLRGCDGSSSHQLLILDEPEIGRSEYWVQLLIERLGRLAVQAQEDQNGGILLVSHRDKVARQGSPTGTYPEMQKVPEKELAEMDEDW